MKETTAVNIAVGSIVAAIVGIYVFLLIGVYVVGGLGWTLIVGALVGGVLIYALGLFAFIWSEMHEDALFEEKRKSK